MSDFQREGENNSTNNNTNLDPANVIATSGDSTSGISNTAGDGINSINNRIS